MYNNLGTIIYTNNMLPNRALSMCWVLLLSIAVLPVFTMIPSTLSGFNRIGYAVFGYLLVPFFIISFLYMTCTLQLTIYENGIVQPAPFFRKTIIEFVNVQSVSRKNVGSMDQTTKCKVFVHKYDGKTIRISQASLESGNEIYNELIKAFDAYKLKENNA